MSAWIPSVTDVPQSIQNLHLKLNAKRRPPSINLPALARRDVRFMSCFKAPPGHTFISCDFSSLEPSITAHFSGDYFYKYSTFDGIGQVPYVHENGTLMVDDIYLMTASRMPGLDTPIHSFFAKAENRELWVRDKEAVTGHKDIKPVRSKAKPACLGFSYGMGPKRFVKQAYDAGMNIESSQAKGMYKAYWDLFGDVRLFSKKIEKIVEKNGFITNPMGYRLTPEPRKAFNAFVQSTASGVVDLLILLLMPNVPYARLVAIVHDEIIVTVPQDQIEHFQRCKEAAVQELNQLLQWSVPMRLSFVVASDFSGIK